MILKIGSVQNMVYLKGRVSLVEQELLILPEQLSSPPIFSFICMFCRSLFVLLYFLFSPLCCLFFLQNSGFFPFSLLGFITIQFYLISDNDIMLQVKGLIILLSNKFYRNRDIRHNTDIYLLLNRHCFFLFLWY